MAYDPNLLRAIAALYKQAGLPQPSSAGVQYYAGKGTVGLDLLRKNLGGRLGTPQAPVDPNAQASSDLQALVDALTPNPVDTSTLSARFASLFDPTYAANAADVNRNADLTLSRNATSRAQVLGQANEGYAAGGASGALVDQQLKQLAQPYDYTTQDTTYNRQQQLLRNKQARASALASYTADPTNRYEFSY